MVGLVDKVKTSLHKRHLKKELSWAAGYAPFVVDAIVEHFPHLDVVDARMLLSTVGDGKAPFGFNAKDLDPVLVKEANDLYESLKPEQLYFDIKTSKPVFVQSNVGGDLVRTFSDRVQSLRNNLDNTSLTSAITSACDNGAMNQFKLLDIVGTRYVDHDVADYEFFSWGLATGVYDSKQRKRIASRLDHGETLSGYETKADLTLPVTIKQRMLKYDKVAEDAARKERYKRLSGSSAYCDGTCGC